MHVAEVKTHFVRAARFPEFPCFGQGLLHGPGGGQQFLEFINDGSVPEVRQKRRKRRVRRGL